MLDQALNMDVFVLRCVLQRVVYIAYHSADLSISLQEVDNLTLVSGFDTGEQSGVTDSSCLIFNAQVVEFTASVSFSFSGLGLGEDTNTTADGFGSGLR